ncbi:hypothetical protein CTI12_AA076720 [Artemisia annua]|uniref:Uncharacterized protein n=1 Tax=Artemisia annua TaxID=35608 RepID=A0A2U1P9I9_ARTAN|nr:hypothetical protein CTI12_AA076720 [Artemisia annua]
MQVAERECHQMRVFERRKYWMTNENSRSCTQFRIGTPAPKFNLRNFQELSRIREVYWREVGQNEKSYLREGVEIKRKKRQRREELRGIEEIYKLEGGENEKSYLREDGETKRKKRILYPTQKSCLYRYL